MTDVPLSKEPARVYVLECGCYSDQWVHGVYSTPELAMAAWPKGNWTDRGDGYWANDLDWDNHATVVEFDVDSRGTE